MLDTSNIIEKTVRQVLGSYDEELLHTLPGGDNGPGSYDPSGKDSDVLLTWIDPQGIVQTGRARVFRQFKDSKSRPYVEASMCPGAWSLVNLDTILRVTRISLI